MVLIWTLGAEDERSRWPNWFRWSSSLDRKLGGMGMDLDGDTVVWHIDLENQICWWTLVKIDFFRTAGEMSAHVYAHFLSLRKKKNTSYCNVQLWLRLLTLSAVLKKTGKVHKEVSLVHQRTHPVESDGGSDGHTSDTGVVPSEETSSWVNGWCSKNLDTSSKLQNTHQQGYSGFNLITFINS